MFRHLSYCEVVSPYTTVLLDLEPRRPQKVPKMVPKYIWKCCKGGWVGWGGWLGEGRGVYRTPPLHLAATVHEVVAVYSCDHVFL